MIKTHGSISENDTVAYKYPKNVGKLPVGGDIYELIPISAEMKDWVEATDLKFEHLYQQINLLQEQLQKVSLGFPTAVLSNADGIKLDAVNTFITKDSSSGLAIDPNPPKLCKDIPNLINDLPTILHHLKAYKVYLDEDIMRYRNSDNNKLKIHLNTESVSLNMLIEHLEKIGE